MNVGSITNKKSLLHVSQFFGIGFPKLNGGGDAPIRSELLSADQMEESGKKLAGSHILDLKNHSGQLLLERLAENEEVLTEVRNLITDAVKAKRQITPADEWLLDNFYLIEEHIQTGKRHLPRGYSRQLPCLANGPSASLPRVYDIALEIISHGDGRVDPERLTRFVSAYQSETILKLGELWAIPIMLRLSLIENLRRIATLVATGRRERDLADMWADKMLLTADKDPKNLILVIADMARSNPPLTSSFVSEFVRRLQGHSPALALPLTWVEQQLADSGFTTERLVNMGSQQQASDQVSISNSIDSLRFLGAMDWQEFVETLSIVDRELRHDPGGAYSRMDFSTRDYYRHVIERISRKSPFTETEIARKVIQLTKMGSDSNGDSDMMAHVGYYLIDKGLSQLEKEAQVHFSFARSLRNIRNRYNMWLYAGSVFLLSFLITGALLHKLLTADISGWYIAIMLTLIFISSIHPSVTIVNWIATVLLKPKPFPRMDFSLGIPPESRTLVVIPTMLVNSQGTEELVEALEVRFLANRDENLHFGLLTDFLDSDSEFLPGDEQLVKLASLKIEELNRKYFDTNSDAFFLFHRPRKWNPAEGRWMGYERKRGKLADLNSLLRGNSANNFSVITGNTEILSNIKYVITLDTDTQLPRDSARQFVGAMAHPLNRAYYDEKKKIVCRGYGIIQPRVAVSLPGTNLSRYSRLHGSEPAIDPYTRAVSDVYQDVFGEGSFIGKGIYDVEVFDRVFSGLFPENRILSHDLLEGCYARSAIMSDVQLFEEYPSSYFGDMKRRHRWIRGDWQIFRWMLPILRGSDGKLRKNPLSSLSRWKIFDNLRRSISPVAFMLLLIFGATILSQGLFWTLIVVTIIVGPYFITPVLDLLHKKADVIWKQHFKGIGESLARNIGQSVFTLACMPFEAWSNIDAIFRTIWRMAVTKKQLLEWNPSGSHNHLIINHIEALRIMWFAPLSGITSIVSLSIWMPAVLLFIWPIPVLWIISPLIALWISSVPPRLAARLDPEQILFLRDISRKTWAFFETFVGPEDNWLPPDNFQEDPPVGIAHRTSPTNIGLSFLANLTARDFGYIHSGQLIERTRFCFRTMVVMERYRGHFYNWYDTKTLKPLRPRYISSVDSGNLVGHLMILQAGLLELPDQKIINPHLFEALNDTLRILKSVIKGTIPSPLLQFEKHLSSALASQSTNLNEIFHFLESLSLSADEVAENIITDDDDQPQYWANALASQCRSQLDELIYLAPWVLSDEFFIEQNDTLLINEIPTLNDLAKIENRIFNSNISGEVSDEKSVFTERFMSAVSLSSTRANQRISAIVSLEQQSAEFTRIEYDFLYAKGRHLQAIGYNVDERIRDTSFYDLLASEARFSTFIAVSKGQIPQESWFALGRRINITGGDPVLFSWSGSMFEYLMPLLVMPTYENTLLDQTYKSAVKRQIQYGKQRGLPWGVSESGYNMVDIHLNYQYRAFGVPGTGLKRGLGEDIVIAPYATMLALMVEPEEACLNLQRMKKEGMTGKYGFYEAMDYTSSRLNRGQNVAIVKSYMAHHQGMGFLSLAFLLLDRPMQRRFESDPLFQSSLLLLQEKIPRTTQYYSTLETRSDIRPLQSVPDMPVRVLTTPDTPVPQVHLLSNGRYHVMVTNSGGGYSIWRDIAVTRWREDTTCDNWGTFCYIRDLENGEFWSSSYQPTLKKPESYEAIFSKGRAEFRRSDNDLDTHTEIVVSPEDDIELRRMRITNRSRWKRNIDVTSYAEIVIANAASDISHPAFSNLFVQTEIVDHKRMILCTRRPRSEDEKVPWMFHLMTLHGAEIKKVSYETDRMKFIGRGNSINEPAAMKNTGSLSGSEGSVLDPVVAIRYEIIIEPEASVRIDMVTGMSESREGAFSLSDKYHDRRLSNRVFELSWTYSQIILTQINATEADAQLYGRLASSIIFANSSLRAEHNIITKNRRGQSGLWGYSISGDLPIVLLRIEDPTNIKLVQQMVQAHAYWRLKGLAVDLVIWNEDHAGYRQLLHDQIMGMIAAGLEANFIDRPGGIFVRSAEQIPNEDKILVQTVARVIISDKRGSLAEQINRRIITDIHYAQFKPTRNYRQPELTDEPGPRKDLLFYNGTGGFTKDGREYIIIASSRRIPPLPWVNVIANPHFGTVVSESGNAYTWCENAREVRLTPWNNDPVTDSGGEILYIRDEESGHFWSPAPFQTDMAGNYLVRHGFGYTVFEHSEDGIRSELWVYVDIDAPVKFSVLKLKNESGRARRLSVTGYVELVLGDLRAKSAMHILTAIDPGSGALFARNHYNSEFGNRIAFFQTDDAYRDLTCDRTEFIGRNRTLRDPAAMYQKRLSGKVGASLDPCAAIQVSFDLAQGKEREVVFRLGSGRNAENASKIVRRFWGSAAARNALEAVWAYWRKTLGAVNFETPDDSLNIMVNGWLMYQTLACRMWARSGYYQSGGAFGFRDQLQDSLAILYAAPFLVRDHLLLCASRQFKEGDVQHWWHPPSGRGVRTKCSDDYLWLPYVTSRYVIHTGDTGVLEEPVNFLEGPQVRNGEESLYDLPIRSEEAATLYQHCVRAILRGLNFGEHGLPLIGTGDWNDGMNMVGHEGKGESVWLGFFLYEVLTQFVNIARIQGDSLFVDRCEKEAEILHKNIEKNSWDGEWYLRAWFDNGMPLGSSTNQECKIDSIAQSWSILSGAGDPEHSLKAMEAVNRHLVRRNYSLIQLLDPPFDKSELNPGYIKGYVPGVRENGGQYTHAAIWAIMAFARIGKTALAWELLHMINPVNHSSSKEDVEIYRVEPYVVAADVYAVNPHTGRGGWTWYTGSAGWLYRLITESLLGVRVEVNRLYLEPKLPENWEKYVLHFRFRETIYNVTIIQTSDHDNESRIILDGKIIEDNAILLNDDGKEHLVTLNVIRKTE